MAITQNDINLINQIINNQLKRMLPQISQKIFSCMTEDIIDGIQGVFEQMLFEDEKIINRLVEKINARYRD